jgi:hypothetical protein
VVGSLEAEADRHVAGGHVDDPARNEERADSARTLFEQRHRGLVDAADAADPRADQDARTFGFVLSLGLDAGIGNRLARRRHREDDERIDLALLLHIHPVVGTELSLGFGAEGDAMCDLAGDIVDLEIVDPLGTAL